MTPSAESDTRVVHDPNDTHKVLTEDEVWRTLDESSFAVLSYITPSGDPRSSGVVYEALARKIYVAVAPDSWKPST